MTSRGLSHAWKIARTHESCYTDSDANITLYYGTNIDNAIPKPESPPSPPVTLACWCSGSIALLDIASGIVSARITSGDDDDDFTVFDTNERTKTLIAHSRRSHLIRQYSLDTRALTAQWRLPNASVLTHLQVSDSGLLMLTVSVDHVIRVYDAVKRYMTHSLQAHTARVNVVRFIDDAHIISADDRGDVRLWTLETSESVLLSNHMSAVTALVLTADKQTAVSAGRDNVISVWSMSTHKLQRTITVMETIKSIILWPANTQLPHSKKRAKSPHILIGGEKGVLRLYDLQTYECVYTFTLPTSSSQPTSQSNTMTNDKNGNESRSIGKQIAHMFVVSTSSQSNSSQIICVTGEQNIYILDCPTLTRSRLIIGFNDEIIDIKYGANDTKLLVVTNSAELRIFDTNTLDCFALISGHNDTILSADISADGQYIITASKDRTVRFWNINNGECISINAGHTESVGAAAFNTINNKQTFAVSGARDRTLKRYDTRVLYKPSTASANKIDGYVPVTATRVAHDKDINSVTVSPNDQLIASASEDKTVRIWSATDLSPVATLSGHRRGVWSCRFSPVDKLLASASGDGTIRIWSLDDYTCIRTLEGHGVSVKAVVWLSEGQQVMSGADDGLLKLWNMKTNECVNTFDAHNDKIWSLAINSTNTHIISGGADSRLCIWTDITIEEEENKRNERTQIILKEQKLSNLMRKSKYQSAIRLCIELQQQRRCATVLTDAIEQTTAKALAAKNKKNKNNHKINGNNNNTNGIESKEIETLEVEEEEEVEEDKGEAYDLLLTKLWSSLQESEWNIMFIFIRDWNTNAITSSLAQICLHSIFRTFTLNILMKNKIFQENIDGILLYSQRHFARTQRYIQQSYIMDYTLDAMRMLKPASATDSLLVKIPSLMEDDNDDFLADLTGAADEEQNGDDETTDINDILKDIMSLSTSTKTLPGALTNGSHILGMNGVNDVAIETNVVNNDDDSDEWIGDDAARTPPVIAKRTRAHSKRKSTKQTAETFNDNSVVDTGGADTEATIAPKKKTRTLNSAVTKTSPSDTTATITIASDGKTKSLPSKIRSSLSESASDVSSEAKHKRKRK